MTYDQGKKKQSVETNTKTNQMLELADTDFEAAIINIYGNVKENDYSKWQDKSQQRHRDYKRQKFWVSKVQYLKRKKSTCMVLMEDWELQKKDVADCIF